MIPPDARIIDLSMPVTVGHFRWPVERRLSRDRANGDSAQVTWAGWGVHSFTHMDAGVHFKQGAFTTSDVSLEQVVGPAAVVDLTGLAANEPVTEAMIASAGAHIERGDIVLLRSGWDTKRSIENADFWTDAPYVTEEAARWLLGRGIKAIGFDFPQDYCIRHFVLGDRQPAWEENTTHVVLLMNGVVMFEYLCNLMAITSPRVTFIGLPVKLLDSDGAPARVIVIEA